VLSDSADSHLRPEAARTASVVKDSDAIINDAGKQQVKDKAQSAMDLRLLQ
jgi:hypothetical protein